MNKDSKEFERGWQAAFNEIRSTFEAEMLHFLKAAEENEDQKQALRGLAYIQGDAIRVIDHLRAKREQEKTPRVRGTR